jgi:hypothetical protein
MIGVMYLRPIWKAQAATALVAVVLLSFGRARSSWADRRERPSLLLGGRAASAPAPVAIDPRLPRGALIEDEPRPSGSSGLACGLSESVCLHFERRLAPALARTYLRELERAARDLAVGLGLPAPLSDVGLGSTPGLDLYLSDAAPLDVQVTADPAVLDGNRRSAFCRARPSRSEARRQAFGCVAESMLFGVNAATPPFLRRALSEYLWVLLGAPAGRDLLAFDTLQANPQLSVAGRDSAPESAGAALLFEHIDARLAAGTPGRLPVALAQLARGHTPPGAPRYVDEPDLIDVLRQAFAPGGPSGLRFEDFMLGFAVERAFVGTRDDGRHHRRLAWLGDAGRVRFDWVLAASSLPRHVAARRPLEAFGCAYVWLDLDRITLGKALAVRAEWESPATFRFALVTVDGEGALLERSDLPHVQNATMAERTLENYDRAAGVLIAGINLGGIDLAHPFDPAHEPSEAHGFTLYVTEL